MHFNVPNFENLWSTYKDCVYSAIEYAEKEEAIIIEAKMEVKEMLKEFEDVFDKETYDTIFQDELNILIEKKRKESVKNRYFNDSRSLLDFFEE